MGNWLRDVRFGFRMLGRNKGFTAVAILALALGIGPNVAIFSIVWATILAPLPYPHANRIVMVWSHYKGHRNITPADIYAELAARSKSFSTLEFSSWDLVDITNPNHSDSGITGTPLTTGSPLAPPVMLGRNYRPGDGAPGRNHIVIIKHKLWVQRYHSDPHIIGKSILVNNQPYTIVGVYTAGPEDRVCCTEFSVPIQIVPGVHSPAVGQVQGMLKPGVTVAQAQAELSTIYSQVAAKFFRGNPHHEWTISVESLKDDFLSHDLIRNLWLLLAAVGLVLLIACANVANLLLARGASRQQELAVRSAMGATRRQVFTQLLIESLTLALLGGIVGIGIGWCVMKIALAMVPTLPAEAVVGLNLPVLAFTCAATLLSGIFFGCIPALHAARLNLADTLKQGSRSVAGRTRNYTQNLLVTAEFALALTLLAGAGMAMHSFVSLANVNLGIRTDHLLTGFLSPANPRQRPNIASPAATLAGMQHLLSRVRALPGVENAAVASGLPLEGHDSFPFSIQGQPVPAQNRPHADLQIVSPGYFSTLGVRVLHGRSFNSGDTYGSQPVAMVSESFVHRYLAAGNPTNHSLMLPNLQFGQKMGAPVPHQIIGVFADVNNGAHLSDKDLPQIFMPYFQDPYPYVALAVRTEVSPATLTHLLDKTVTRIDPSLTLARPLTMRQVIHQQLKGDRFSMSLFVAFAVLALLLAALGIYGVMAFAVSRRTHEIGLRMALGAEKRHVVALIVRGGMRLALVGAAIGFIGAFLLGRAMRGTLYGIGSIDYLSLTLVALLLLAVALLASWLPARRSARIDPMIALREE